jgi:hypothetical protein
LQRGGVPSTKAGPCNGEGGGGARRRLHLNPGGAAMLFFWSQSLRTIVCTLAKARKYHVDHGSGSCRPCPATLRVSPVDSAQGPTATWAGTTTCCLPRNGQRNSAASRMRRALNARHTALPRRGELARSRGCKSVPHSHNGDGANGKRKCTHAARTHHRRENAPPERRRAGSGNGAAAGSRSVVVG